MTCITNKGTKIDYLPGDNIRKYGIYRIQRSVGLIGTILYVTRDQALAIAEREGIKEGKIE